CATQFAFFHRQCRIEFANELRKEPRELLLYLYEDIARKRFMQRQSPTFEDGCRQPRFDKLRESVVDDRFEPRLRGAASVFGKTSKAFEVPLCDLLERGAQQCFTGRKIVL